MGEGGGLRRIRFSSGDWIIGAGKTGAILYAGYGPGVRGWTVAPHPTILAHPPPPPPPPRLQLIPLGGAVCIQKTSSVVRLVDAWLLFFSNMEYFMAELRMKYVCRSAVALVDTNCFGVPFSFLFRFLVAQGNLVPLVTTGKCWNIHNSPGITPENTT